ncbi:uncharacterized protein [Primulina eburnea]|uniref:uncharacterized protein n=1 Tax=Primulina eburnea TaxID=1245227 RepID=UPI003C6C8392
MTQFFAQFAGNKATVDTRTRPRPEAVYKRFMRINPKEFLGTTGPMIAEGWIESIEVIFAFTELQDADRVRCATFLLTWDARLWWDSASVSVNLPTLTWNGFKEVFYSKYFTEEVRSRLTREFMMLRQGDNSVADFVRKFKRGVAGPTTYVVVVSRTLATKQDHRDIEVDGQGMRPYQALQQQQQRPQFKKPYQGQPGNKPYQGPSKSKGLFYSRRSPEAGQRSHAKGVPAVEGVKISTVLEVKKELNMRKSRLLELVKDNDCEICYHPGKANVVADALSRKVAVVAQMSAQRSLQSEIQRFDLEVYPKGRAPKLSNLTVQSSLFDRIRVGQPSDE